MAYFTLAEARKVPGLESTTDYPNADIEAMRAVVEAELEQAAGVAFEPRTAIETVSGFGGRVLFVSRRRVREVVSALHEGAVLPIAGTRVVGLRRFHRPEGWPPGVANIRLEYRHGHDAPPGRIKRAALILTKEWLVRGPVTDRATQISAGDGGVINMATPGLFGSDFGLPEVDAAVKRYGYTDVGL